MWKREKRCDMWLLSGLLKGETSLNVFGRNEYMSFIWRQGEREWCVICSEVILIRSNISYASAHTPTFTDHKLIHGPKKRYTVFVFWCASRLNRGEIEGNCMPYIYICTLWAYIYLLRVLGNNSTFLPEWAILSMCCVLAYARSRANVRL